MTVLMWTSFLVLRAYFAPEPPPVAKKAADSVVKKAADKGDESKADVEPIAKRADGDPERGKVDAEAPEAPEIAARPARAQEPRKRLTLGSADRASGFSAVYYFDNRGAALECTELNGFQSVADFSGYLGRLGLVPHTGGMQVTVVGPGTPAAIAKGPAGIANGLQVGDVILSVDGEPLADPLQLDHYLEENKRPDQQVVLKVLRGEAAEPLEFVARLTRRPLEVVAPETHTYQTAAGLKRLGQDPLSLLLTLDKIGTRTLSEGQGEFAKLPSLYTSNWKVEAQGDDFIEFSFTLEPADLAALQIQSDGPLKFLKRYTAPRATEAGDIPYHLVLDISIKNEGTTELPIAYRLLGPTGLPLEGWWFSTKLHPDFGAGAGARDIVWNQPSPGRGHRMLGGPKIVSEAKEAEKKDKQSLIPLLAGDQASPLLYAGVDTQFFAGVLKPLEENNQPLKFSNAFALAVQEVSAIPKSRLRTANVSVRLVSSTTTVAAGQALTHRYQVFLGPKDPKVLAAYQLDELIEFGWPIFGVPAKMLRQVLNGLYALTSLIGIPNYGIAIILLTVIVRSCMIPVSLKQARSAAKMQELAPEVQKIKDRFPDDPMKQHQAVQELYKKHDFNMFGGCLPVFIQLPIFIGLYRCLSVDISLRDASLIPGISWASNLAGPDKLFRWDQWMPAFFADEADGWLGPFFNVFPLITVALFLVQQKMFTPPATDEQTKMQQQMMTYMTVFMGVMFYKVPAGLCIYFITSSLWGIAERKLLPKSKPKEGTLTDSEGGGGKGGGGSGLAALLAPRTPAPNGSTKGGSGKRPKQRR